MNLIDGVVVKELKVIPDDRGYLMECMRCDDPFFEKFGQVYISAVYENVVKGWHFHRRQTDHVVCVKGMIKLAIYDTRDGSPTREVLNVFHVGDQDPKLVTIPKGCYHGWMGIAPGLSLVMNCPTEAYCYDDPDEERLPAHDNGVIPYEWSRKDG